VADCQTGGQVPQRVPSHGVRDNKPCPWTENCESDDAVAEYAAGYCDHGALRLRSVEGLALTEELHDASDDG
jgi:hypothetical protein